MAKYILSLILLAVSLLIFYFYFNMNVLPPGVESKGDQNLMPIISLITAICSLIGSVLTFTLKIIEIRSSKRVRG